MDPAGSPERHEPGGISIAGDSHPGQASSRREQAFTLIELLVVVAIIGILAAIAIPQLLGARTKAYNSSCDAIFHSLDGEISNELDTALMDTGGKASCGCSTNTCVLSCLVLKHIEEKNPRNRNDPAFMDLGVSTYSTCQIGLETRSSTGIVLSQMPSTGGQTRTFSILIE